jgi:hypothetical protein
MTKLKALLLSTSFAFVLGCGSSAETTVPAPNSERPAQLTPEQEQAIKKSMEEASKQ